MEVRKQIQKADVTFTLSGSPGGLYKSVVSETENGYGKKNDLQHVNLYQLFALENVLTRRA